MKSPPISVYFNSWIGMFTRGAIWILTQGHVIYLATYHMDPRTGEIKLTTATTSQERPLTLRAQYRAARICQASLARFSLASIFVPFVDYTPLKISSACCPHWDSSCQVRYLLYSGDVSWTACPQAAGRKTCMPRVAHGAV